jgi:diguanylate cyclase (GGDEF)-like protein
MPRRATDRRVLVFAPGLDNGRVIARRLEAAVIGCTLAVDAGDFAAKLDDGGEAWGAVVVTADAMRQGAGRVLTRLRSAEPAWSALPVVLLAPLGTGGIDAWPHTATLTQPTTARELIAVVERAIAARSHQRQLALTNDTLQQLAHRDALTGLPNRWALDERIRALQRDRREPRATFTVLFVDVDDFKAINDAYGHAAGDEALCQVGAFLQRTVRETDFVARWGGDEFVVLLEGAAGSAEVAETLGRFGEGVAVRISTVEAPRIVTLSVGHVDGVGSDLTPDEILRLADARMYQRKLALRGRSGS